MPVRQVPMLRIDDGRIREHWAARDDLAVLVQSGAVEPPTLSRAVAR